MIDLIRYGSLPGIGTFGEMHVGAHTFYTVEQDWENNEPFVSCIPAGEYVLVPHSSAKYGETYALVGDTVSQFEDDYHARYACLIHSANYSNQVQGCIGLGRSLTHINGRLGVTHSRDAVADFKRLIAIEDKYLTIKWRHL